MNVSSSGGLICRALLSMTPDHNVHTFIALSSPLAGQYGGGGSDTKKGKLRKLGVLTSQALSFLQTDTEYLRNLFPDSVKKTLFLVCYNGVGQKVSVCGYWNDPHHRSRYLKSNNFLPLLNGDTPHKEMEAWKDNFLRIKKLVLIGGPDDGVITPWQSSHFGFYDNKERIVEMRNQKFYRNDTFGLKTLSARGDVSLCLQSGVQHIRWHSNYTVFSSCMEEWLT